MGFAVELQCAIFLFWQPKDCNGALQLAKKDISAGVTIDYFGVNVSVGVGQGPAVQKAMQTPNVGLGVYGAWNPGGGKNLATYGKYGPGGGVYMNNYGKPTGGYVSFCASLLPYTGYRSF